MFLLKQSLPYQSIVTNIVMATVAMMFDINEIIGSYFKLIEWQIGNVRRLIAKEIIKIEKVNRI